MSNVKSREEIRFLALLTKTQEKAAGLKNEKKKQNGDSGVKSADSLDETEVKSENGTNHDKWRLPKFVDTLNEWLQALERHPQGPSKDVMVEYSAKVDFLKKVLESRASQQLATRVEPAVRRSDVVDVAGGTRRRSLRSTSPPDVTEVIRPIPILPHGPAVTSDTITKEIHHNAMERHNDQMREALFGTSDNDSEVRRRNITGDKPDANDLDYLLKAHHQAQEQVAEEMLSLTKTLKEQSLAAKEVILKDTATIDKANELADKNTTRLTKEADRLQEHSKFSCRCWIWLLIVIVSMTFISMVWVMKFFRKRSDY